MATRTAQFAGRFGDKQCAGAHPGADAGPASQGNSTTDALKVGIAVDGSKYGREAVKYMLRHLALFGAKPEVTLLHVVSDFAGAVMPDMGASHFPRFPRKRSGRCRRRPSRPQWVRRASCSPRPHQANRSLPRRQRRRRVVAYAKKKKLDVLVMGSHGYGAFQGRGAGIGGHARDGALERAAAARASRVTPPVHRLRE